MHYITVGTAGHVDHGKTTMIKSLTGIDTDRLKEEKQRGLTIDLGFAYLPIDDDFTISFIDVPGHEKFLKNMLTGITGISFVLLVIAANEGIMPQTIEHLQILKLLNISQGAIILTKVDLVENEFQELVIEEIKETVKDSFLENSPLIKFSALSGSGKAELMKLFEKLKYSFIEKKTDNKVVFPIDRVFTKKGFGTIVTGTLNSGTINAGELLQLMPDGKKIRIKQIQVHNKKSESVKAGTRAALSIPELDIKEIHRGDIIISPDAYRLTDTIDINLKLLKELKQELKSNTRIKFYHFCSETSGRISFPGKKTLSPGADDFARIKLEKTITVPHNTSFVLRNYSPHFVIGGGKVLNPYPSDKKIQAGERIKVLNYYNEQKYIALATDFLANCNKIFRLEELQELLPADSWENILNYLVEYSLIIFLGNNLYVSTEMFKNKQSSLLEIIDSFHKENPSKIGISKQELHRTVKAELVLLENLLNSLKGNYLLTYENLYFNKVHKIVLSDTENTDTNKILKVLEKERYQNLKDLLEGTKIKSNDLEELLKILIYKNQIEELTDKVYVSQIIWQTTVEEIKALIIKVEKLTTSQAKDHLSTTRKYIIPILETLDKKQVTKREGDFRVLNTLPENVNF